MADNVGVLGTAVGTTVATHTVYTCPANKSAKFRIFGSWIGTTAGSTVLIRVNNVIVALTAAFGANNTAFTNGGAGLLRAPGATGPTGASAAETAQPAPPIYYLSAGGSVSYDIGTAALTTVNVQVVGVEVDLTL